MSRIREIVFGKAAVEFATVAREYCNFIEQAPNAKLSNFIRISHSLLPLLYYKATLLPTNEPLSELGNQKFVTEEQYLSLHERLKALLGEHDDFPEVFDERVIESEDQFSATISEYLTDVYQDLKDFVMLYQNGQEDEMNDALWECRHTFGEYWGIRLANVIRAIHQLAVSSIDFDTKKQSVVSEKDAPVDTQNWFITRRQNESEGDN